MISTPPFNWRDPCIESICIHSLSSKSMTNYYEKAWIKRLTSAAWYLPSATKLWKLCSYVSVILSTGGGIPACIAGSIPACLAVGGLCYPRMPMQKGGCLLPGGACSRQGRVPAPGGACSRGVCSGGVCSGGVETPPQSRRLLLRTIRILLECILVSVNFSVFCVASFK